MSVDIDFLPLRLQASARSSGQEWCWPLADAVDAIEAMALNNRTILGLDLRTYDEHEKFFEVAWSVYEGDDPVASKDFALAALGRPDLPGDWVLITWRAVDRERD